MILPFGKHFGLAVKLLVLRDPGYGAWARPGRSAAGLANVQREIRRLIGIFDAKPLTGACSAADCGNAVTIATAYSGSTNLMWWCDDCGRREASARSGKVRLVRTYLDAAGHVGASCPSGHDEAARLVRGLARAKGLQDVVGERQALAFFDVARPPRLHGRPRVGTN